MTYPFGQLVPSDSLSNSGNARSRAVFQIAARYDKLFKYTHVTKREIWGLD